MPALCLCTGLDCWADAGQNGMHQKLMAMYDIGAKHSQASNRKQLEQSVKQWRGKATMERAISARS